MALITIHSERHSSRLALKSSQHGAFLILDIALGLSTDGFGPFKRRTKTAWPIILFNYNLPPKEHFLKRNIILIGVVPGPKKPCDFNSFLWPLVQELLQLENGVSAFDSTLHSPTCPIGLRLDWSESKWTLLGVPVPVQSKWSPLGLAY